MQFCELVAPFGAVPSAANSWTSGTLFWEDVLPAPAAAASKTLTGGAGPGFFRVTRPDELWHLDMTKVWTAAHGWVNSVNLHVAVDCLHPRGHLLAPRSQNTIRGGDLLPRVGHPRPPGAARPPHPRQRQRLAIHQPRLPLTPLRPRRHPPPRRLPRPRVPSVHRVLVRAVQETLRLARRMGNPSTRRGRRSPTTSSTSPPTPLRNRLPHPHRSRRHLATRPTTTNPSDLNRQRRGVHIKLRQPGLAVIRRGTQARLPQLTGHTIDRRSGNRSGMDIQTHTRTLNKHRGLPRMSDRPGRQPCPATHEICVSEAPARNRSTQSGLSIPSSRGLSPAARDRRPLAPPGVAVDPG
jgi:hypothetical protein